ncbi:MAG TPA: hypothetical protein VFN50_10390 [Acidimicrobiales bacterium]|nr:hypothetical protein [Acidimicrobiales bacterium]
MLRRRLVTRGAAALAAAALLAACGGGNGLAGQSAGQIMTSTISALRHAHSVRLSGVVDQGPRTAHVDVTMFRNGDADGTFDLSGVTGSLVISSGSVYMRGPARFWQVLTSIGGASLPGAAATKLAGRWVILPRGAASGFSSFSFKGFESSLSKGRASLSKVGPKTVMGQQAIGVKSPNNGTLWVSTTGTAYPIEVVSSNAKGTQRATFSDWNADSPPTAPAGAKSLATILG